MATDDTTPEEDGLEEAGAQEPGANETPPSDAQISNNPDAAAEMVTEQTVPATANEPDPIPKEGEEKGGSADDGPTPVPATVQEVSLEGKEPVSPKDSVTTDEVAAASEESEADEAPIEVDVDGDLPELTLGAEDGEPAEPKPDPIIRGKIDKHGHALGTGRRKTSVARVRIKDGDGGMTINGRDLEEYFPTERDRAMIEAPLKATETHGGVDVWVRVSGGGTTGQTGAIVLGIARALTARDPGYHEALSSGGYLTRDSRMVERKKYGYKKARKSFQFSKR